MEEELIVSDPAAVAALLHPLRTRILQALDTNIMTPSEVARAIGEAASKVHYHMRIMEKHGLVKLVEQRKVGSITELYFQVTAKQYSVRMEAQAGSEQVRSLVDAQIKDAMEQIRRFSKRVGENPEENRRGHLSIQSLTARETMLERVKEQASILDDRIREIIAKNPNQSYKLIVALIPVEKEDT